MATAAKNWWILEQQSYNGQSIHMLLQTATRTFELEENTRLLLSGVSYIASVS